MDDLHQHNPHININIEEESDPQIVYDIDEDERNWGLMAHLSALLGLVIPSIGAILGPFLVWQMKGQESEYIEAQAKEALNFQISMFIYFVVSGLLCIILIGIPMLFVFGVIWVVSLVLACIKADKGIVYRYKFNMNLIK